MLQTCISCVLETSVVCVCASADVLLVTAGHNSHYRVDAALQAGKAQETCFSEGTCLNKQQSQILLMVPCSRMQSLYRGAKASVSIAMCVHIHSYKSKNTNMHIHKKGEF